MISEKSRQFGGPISAIQPAATSDRETLTFSDDENEWSAPAWCDYSTCYTHEGPAKAKDADLRGSDLRDARLALSDFRDVDAQACSMNGAELTYSDFTRANLRNADLTGACLCLADLSGADLRDANLAGADLMKAVLEGADLRGARLAGACLTGANLTGARYDQATELPFSFEEARANGMIFGSGAEVKQ